jgi:O-antigen/teichoic acid export membrane protein
MDLLQRNLVANYLGQGWSGLMGLVFIPLYVRYMGIEAYGLIGLFAVLQVFMSLLDIGMSPTLSREMSRFTAGFHTPQLIRNLLRSLEFIVLGLACTIIASISSAAEWLANDWLRIDSLVTEEVVYAFVISGSAIGFRFCEGIYRSALIGLQQQVWLNTVRAILSTLQYAGVLPVLSLVSPTITAFFLWQAACALLAVAIYSAKLYRTLPTAPAPARFSLSALNDVWRFAGGLLAINTLTILLTQTDKVLLSRLLILEDYGYYTLAATLAAGLSMIIGPITQAFYPRMVECYTRGENEALARTYHQGAQLVSVITAPLMAITLFFPEGVLYLWSGDISLASSASPLLAILIVGGFLNGQMWMPYHCQLAHGWTSLSIKINIVAVLIIVPAILWFVPLFGAIAAAWSWLALNLGYGLIGIHFMHRRVLSEEKGRWYVWDVLLPTIGCGSLVYALKVFFAISVPQSRITLGLFLFCIGLLAQVAALSLSQQFWVHLTERRRNFKKV